MGKTRVDLLVAGLLATLLSGCSTLGRVIPNIEPANTATSMLQHARTLTYDSAPKVAGTYQGSYSERIRSTTVKGTVTIVLQQNGSKISGKFDIKVKGYSFNTTFKGTVSAAPHGARLHFTIFNVGGTRNAKAHATVIGSKLNGKGKVPATASKPAIYLKFKTKKTA
jgi:hypothetical protein